MFLNVFDVIALKHGASLLVVVVVGFEGEGRVVEAVAREAEELWPARMLVEKLRQVVIFSADVPIVSFA